MARRPRNTPLTEDQKSLAASYVPYAWSLCKPAISRCPWAADEILSAAYLALTISARDHDPSRGRFATFARFKILGEIGYAIRSESSRTTTIGVIEGLRRRGWRDRQIDIADPRDDIEMADSEDAVRSIIGKLPGRMPEALWLTVVEELAQSDAASVMGLSQNRVSQLVSQSRRMLGVDSC